MNVSTTEFCSLVGMSHSNSAYSSLKASSFFDDAQLQLFINFLSRCVKYFHLQRPLTSLVCVFFCQVAMTHPAAVTACNLDLENLITDSNRSIATLAITTLLKTGLLFLVF